MEILHVEPPRIEDFPFFQDKPIANIIHATGPGPFSERRQRQAKTEDPFEVTAWLLRTGRVSPFHAFIGRDGRLGFGVPSACMGQHCSTRHLWRDRNYLGNLTAPQRAVRARLVDGKGLDKQALKRGYGPINQRTRGIELIMDAKMLPTKEQLWTLVWLVGLVWQAECNIAHSSVRPGRRTGLRGRYDLTEEQGRAVCRVLSAKGVNYV